MHLIYESILFISPLNGLFKLFFSFFIALSLLGRMQEDIPGAYGPRQGRVHPRISHQINAELCVSICEFTTLLETTSGVF